MHVGGSKRIAQMLAHGGTRISTETVRQPVAALDLLDQEEERNVSRSCLRDRIECEKAYSRELITAPREISSPRACLDRK